jgi:hypothetical protein
MFAPDTPMTLTDVTFTTEEVDEETRRIVVCTFGIVPFTGAQADALNVRSLLFDLASGQPKEAIETIVLNIDMPLQRLTFAMAPDQADRRIVLPNVKIESKLRAKVKRDRDPMMVDAVLKVSFHYPTAAELLYIANGVNDTHYLTFEPEQGDLLTTEADAPAAPPRRRGRGAPPMAEGDELRPGVHAEH